METAFFLFIGSLHTSEVLEIERNGKGVGRGCIYDFWIMKTLSSEHFADMRAYFWFFE